MENTNQPKPDEQTPPQAEQRPSLRMYALYALVVIAGMGVAKIAFDYYSPRFLPKQQKRPVAVAQTPAPRPYTVAPVPAPLAAPIEAMKKKVKQVTVPFELNGLYLSDGEAYALVNNKIVQEGDQVDGATVMKIGEEEVQLNHDDKVIVLTTRK